MHKMGVLFWGIPEGVFFFGGEGGGAWVRYVGRIFLYEFACFFSVGWIKVTL